MSPLAPLHKWYLWSIIDVPTSYFFYNYVSTMWSYAYTSTVFCALIFTHVNFILLGNNCWLWTGPYKLVELIHTHHTLYNNCICSQIVNIFMIRCRWIIVILSIINSWYHKLHIGLTLPPYAYWIVYTIHLLHTSIVSYLCIYISAYDKDWKLSRHSFPFANSVKFPLIIYENFRPNLIWLDICLYWPSS